MESGYMFVLCKHGGVVYSLIVLMQAQCMGASLIPRLNFRANNVDLLE